MPAKSKQDRALDKLINEVNEKYTLDGSEVPVVARGDEHRPVQFVRCGSPACGYVLGTGGWARGKLHEFFGREHSGKTVLMLSALRDVYEAEKGKRKILLIDVEHRYNDAWARQLGFPADDCVVVQPPDAERATDIMSRFIQSGEICAVGFDSIGAAEAKWGHETFEDREYTVGRTAAVMSRNVKTIAPVANYFGATCFYTNQVRADMDGRHRVVTPGGHTVKHMMSVRLYIRPGKEKWTDKAPGGKVVDVGFPMIFKCVKNTFGPPTREAWSDFYFAPSVHFDGIGFDRDRDLQRLGILTGVVEQKGAWYEWKGVRGQGRLNFFGELRESGRVEEFAEEVMGRLLQVEGEMEDRPQARDADLPDDPEI